MVNTVLCSIFASEFSAMSAKIEGGASAREVAQATLNEHWSIIFNGNGYSAEWPVEAVKRGIPNHSSCVDAISALGNEKAVKLFSGLKDDEGISVMSESEVKCREAVMLDQYCNVVEMECLCMIDMIRQHVLPSALKALGLGISAGPPDKLRTCIATLEAKLKEMEHAEEGQPRARVARELRLEAMAEVRSVCDEAESAIPPEMWTLGTYKELLFLDSHHGSVEISGKSA